MQEIPHLKEMVTRLVEDADPEQIILFGSYARGEAGDQSDVDLLVVEEKFISRREEMVRLRRAVRQYRVPVDLLVFSREEVARFGDIPGHILYPALREGRLLYAKQGEGKTCTSIPREG